MEQDRCIFSGSARDNLTLGMANVTDAALQVRVSNAGDWVTVETVNCQNNCGSIETKFTYVVNHHHTVYASDSGWRFLFTCTGSCDCNRLGDQIVRASSSERVSIPAIRDVEVLCYRAPHQGRPDPHAEHGAQRVHVDQRLADHPSERLSD